MSGEAFFIGAGGEEAFGATVGNSFGAASGVVGAVGAAMDPNAVNGIAAGSYSPVPGNGTPLACPAQ